MRQANGDDEYHFASWNAHACYFRDPAGNILEFIARHNLKNDRPGEFSARDILAASEIGVVVDDVPGLATDVDRQLGLRPFAGTSAADFAALGDDPLPLLGLRASGPEQRPHRAPFGIEVHDSPDIDAGGIVRAANRASPATAPGVRAPFFRDAAVAGAERHPRGHGLRVIDHMTHNVYRGRMAYWAAFYEKLFNFRQIRYFDIKGEYTGLTSKAMTAPDGLIRIPLNEEASKTTGQIEEFLMAFNGEGIQHIALLTDDITTSIDALDSSASRTGSSTNPRRFTCE